MTVLRGVFLFAVGMLASVAAYAESSLVVTVIEVGGDCLHEGARIPVTGNLISWQIYENDRPLTSKGSSHSWEALYPVSKSVDFKGAGGFNFFYYESLINDSGELAIKLGGDQKKRREFLVGERLRLNKDSLYLASSIYRIGESELYRVNKLEASKIFEHLGDRTILVPQEMVICELAKYPLMEKAKAIYKRKWGGRVEILSDSTVPMRGKSKTFAEELLDEKFGR